MLLFPGGRARFNPAHVASKGGKVRFSAVASGKSFVNLLKGRVGTVGGSPAPVASTVLGQTLNFQGASDVAEFSGQSVANDAAVTIATIVQFSATASAFQVIFVSSLTSGGVSLYLSSSGSPIVEWLGGGSFNSNFNLSPNIPYFIIASGTAATGITFQFQRLDNGQIVFNGTTAGSATPGAPDGTYQIANNTNFSQPLLGRMSAIMFSGAAISQGDFLKWSQDPWSFWYEQRQLNRAMLFSQAAAGGGISVTVDFGCGFEFVGSLRRDGLAILEWLASVRADRPLQLEAIGAVRRDGSGSPEFIAGLSANVAAQLEFLGSMQKDNLGPLETVAALRSDVVVLMETASGLRSDITAATEIVASLRSDLIGPLETTGSFRSDAPVSAEFTGGVTAQATAQTENLSGMAGNSPVEIENLGAITVTGNSAVQLETTAKLNVDQAMGSESVAGVRSDAAESSEITAGVARQTGAAIENVAGVAGNSAAEIENLGAIAVSGNSAVQLETQAKLNSDQAIGSESISGMRSDAVSDLESLAGASRQAGTGVEFLAKVQSDRVAQVENLGALAVTGNAPAPIEITAAMRSDARSEIDSVSKVQGSPIGPTEITASARSDTPGPAESLTKLQREEAAQSEVQGGVSVTAGAPVQIEFTSSIAAFGAAILEFFSSRIARLNPNYIARGAPRRLVATGRKRRFIVIGISNHMSQTNDLQPTIDSTVEIETVTFDYGLMLTPGVIIEEVLDLTISVVSGSDRAPASRLIGTSSIVSSPNSKRASQAVSQLVGQMIANSVYRLQCVATTSDGQTLSLWTHLTCIQPN